MDSTDSQVRISLRIPGNWEHPTDLYEQMPSEIQFREHSLLMPDGCEIELSVSPPDDQFAGIFRSSCRTPPGEEELAIVDSYKVKIGLSRTFDACDLNEMQAARSMMRAAAAFVQAGAGGVFIDNSGLAHGGSQWQAMYEDGGTDALSFAFVTIIHSDHELWTMGMHVFGLAEVAMKIEDVDENGTELIETIRYLCTNERSIEDEHILADENGPRFQVGLKESTRIEPGSPLHNPFGEMQLTSIKDIVERN